MFTDKDLEKLREYKDIHKGKRCFIVGTGPSLTLSDLELIKGEISFTCNAGYKVYDKTEWRADYYAVTDDSDAIMSMLNEVIEGEYKHKGIFVDSMKNVPKDCDEIVRVISDSTHLFFMDTLWNRMFSNKCSYGKFRVNIEDGLYMGKTVVYACIGLAAYMGITEIYLLGVDCSYDLDAVYADFFEQDAMDWDIAHKIRASKLMRRQFEALAKTISRKPDLYPRIYNASRGGALESFPRVSLEDIL